MKEISNLVYGMFSDKIISILSHVSNRLLIQFLYYVSYKRFPNLKEPTLFSEKINYLALNDFFKDPQVSICADKVRVRDYIEGLGLKEILINNYGVWENAKDIDWDALPSKFVLKCNHGSGYNIVCTDKSKLDINDVTNRLNNWLKNDYWKRSGELFYKDIKPLILCEEFIKTSDGLPPKDYKFFCSYGEPKFLFVAQERGETTTKFDFFTPEWEFIPVTDAAHPHYQGNTLKPDGLEKMLSLCRIIAKKWPLVRVDFYNEKGKVYFGEITFMHHAGHPIFVPAEYDRIFGEMFPLTQ